MEDGNSAQLTGRIARRVRELRTENALSLDDLAARSGVSRSMISLIEPTLGGLTRRLDAGDCLAMRLDRALTYHSPTAAPARCAVVLCSETGPWR